MLVIGLGNPGEKYSGTRHNTGFLTVDFLRASWNFEDFHEEKKFSAQISTGMIGKTKVTLVKPETFMNESGKSVRTLVDFYKLSAKNLIVMHDDVDLAMGKMKMTESSGSAGHRGVESIIDTLGTQDFFRIRFGIGRPVRIATRSVAGGPVPANGACISIHDYVLQKFSPEEKEKLESLFPEVETLVKNRLEK